MKITVIHGDDSSASRKRYQTIIDAIHGRGWDIVHISPKSVTKLDEQLAFSGNMFATDILYVIDDAGKLGDRELKWLSKNTDLDANLIMWFKGAIPAPVKKILPKNTNIEKFDAPKQIFSLLSKIAPGKGREVALEIRKMEKTDPIELVFAMLSRHFRDLYWAAADPTSMGLPDWRVGKLKSQAKLFGEEKLALIINKLSEADIMAKKSERPLPLSLDLILIEGLQ